MIRFSLEMPWILVTVELLGSDDMANDWFLRASCTL